MTEDSPSAESAQSTYLSDAPLSPDKEGLKRDVLGFDGLSSHLVSEIDRCPTAQGSFVFGIHGRWGSGKSSLLNLARYGLKEKNSYLVLPFNPWLQPGRDHVEAFFYDLAASFRLLPDQKSFLRTVSSIERFADSLASTNIAITGLSKVLNALVTIFSLSTLSIVPMLAASDTVGLWILGIILVVGSFTFLDRLADKFLSYYKKKCRPPLMSVKEDLASCLRSGTKRVVVVIDDIDRLPPKDTCQIFQLVKNNGDLPNIVYLLGFDRAVVRRVLTKEYGAAYSQFTEKIVQQEFPIPMAERGAIPRFVETELDRAVSNCGAPDSLKKYWSVERWTNTWVLQLQGFVSTIRDAKRIVNSVRMHMPLMIEDGIMEIDPVDFLVMEFLAVKFPDLHDYIGRNKEFFIHTRRPNRFLDLSDPEKRHVVNGFNYALKLAPSRERESVKELIQQLFPLSGTVEIGVHAHPPAEDDVDRMRIFYEPIFERYFTYLIYEGDVSNAMVESAYGALLQPDKFVEYVTPLKKSPRLRILLEKLRRRLTRLGDRTPRRSNFISLLLELADDLTDNPGQLEDPIHWFVPNTIERTLKNEKLEIRANILEGLLPALKRPFGLLTCLGLWESESNSKPNIEHFLTRQRLDQLIRGSIRLGREWFNSSQWLDHPHFPRLLWLVKHWSDSDFEATLKGRLMDAKEFKKFLAHYLLVIETVKYGEAAGPVDYQFNFVGVKEVIDLKWLYDKAWRIGTDGTDSEKEKLALNYFRDDYQKYVAGEIQQP